MSPGNVSTPGQIVCPQLPNTVQHLCFTAVVSGSCCWQFIVIWLCTRVLDSQDSIVWSGRKGKHDGCLSSWKCFLHVDTFCGTLFCIMKTELNLTLLVVQTILPTMSHLCQVRTINTKKHCYLALRIALMLQFGVQDTSQTCCAPFWQKPEFPLSSFVFLSNYPPFLLCPLFAPAWEAGWVITRALCAGWLPLIESSQQIVFYEQR